MKSESKLDVEFVEIKFPGKDYEEKLTQLVEALLAMVENPRNQAEDSKSLEAA